MTEYMTVNEFVDELSEHPSGTNVRWGVRMFDVYLSATGTIPRDDDISWMNDVTISGPTGTVSERSAYNRSMTDDAQKVFGLPAGDFLEHAGIEDVEELSVRPGEEPLFEVYETIDDEIPTGLEFIVDYAGLLYRVETIVGRHDSGLRVDDASLYDIYGDSAINSYHRPARKREPTVGGTDSHQLALDAFRMTGNCLLHTDVSLDRIYVNAGFEGETES